MERTDYPLMLKAKHIAEIMGCHISSAYEYMRHEGMPTVREGGIVRVHRDLFFERLEKEARSN